MEDSYFSFDTSTVVKLDFKYDGDPFPSVYLENRLVLFRIFYAAIIHAVCKVSKEDGVFSRFVCSSYLDEQSDGTNKRASPEWKQLKFPWGIPSRLIILLYIDISRRTVLYRSISLPFRKKIGESLHVR